jgi:SAM-dependent methyltransferase
MTVLEPGPAMGFFTLELARLVGPSGRVVAVDLQAKMLEALARRARKRGLAERIETRLATADALGIADLAGRADFALVFAMAHEVSDPARLFADVAAALRSGGRLLFDEPKTPVSEAQFAESLRLLVAHGLRVEARPAIRTSRAAVLVKA